MSTPIDNFHNSAANKKRRGNIALSISLCFIALLITISLFTPPTAKALISEGGPIVWTYPFPCSNPFGWWTIKLTNTTGVYTPMPVIYPYLPPTITKLDFLPAFPGTSTVSNVLPAGGCLTVIPCPFGLCPIVLPGATSVVHGIAVQPF